MLAPLFKLIEAIIELQIPLLVADIIDVGIANADTRYIVLRALLMAGLALVGLGFSLTAQYFAARAAVGFSRQLKHALVAHIQQLSYAELDKLGAAQIINRINSDTQSIQNGINMFLRLFLRSPFVVFGAMVMAFTVDRSAWVFAVVIPTLTVFVVTITALCVRWYRRAQNKLDEVTLAVRENLTGVRVLRAFAYEDKEVEDFAVKHKQLTAAQSGAGRIAAMLNPLTYAVVNGGVVLLLWLGAKRVDSGQLTQGGVIALYNYMAQLTVELIKLADLVILLTKSAASGGRINEVFAMRSAQVFGAQWVTPSPCPYAVQMHDVCMRYSADAAPSLQHIDLTIEKGQTVGIIGTTGAGKSTLVNLLARLYDATEGSLLLDGVSIECYPKAQLRAKVAYVAQYTRLMAGTIRDNLLFGNLNATDERLWRALQLAQLDGTVREKGGLDYVLEENGKNLSGGQRQRLSIARALAADADIVVLDDSTSALDNLTQEALCQGLKTLNATVLVVSQRTQLVREADTIVVMDNGAIVGRGKHDELLQTCPLYAEIHSLGGGAL